MSYHGLHGLGADLLLTPNIFASGPSADAWRSGVKKSASEIANMITGLSPSEKAARPWARLQQTMLQLAIASDRETKDQLRFRLAAIPTGAPSTPGVNAIRAKREQLLGLLVPPVLSVGPKAPPVMTPYVKTGPSPAEVEAARKVEADRKAAADQVAREQAAREQAARDFAVQEAARQQAAKDADDRAMKAAEQQRVASTQEPASSEPPKERYAEPAKEPASMFDDAFGPPGPPPTSDQQQPASIETQPGPATQTARPGFLGVPWLWWGIGGAVVLAGGGYALSQRNVTPNRRRGSRMKRNAKMKFWNVSLHGRVIDSVPYTADMTADEVKRSLVSHDGYDPAIKVTPKRWKKS